MVGLFHFSSFFLKAFETPLPKNIALELVMTKCPSLKSLLGVENFYKLGTWEISICITLNQHFDTEIIWTLTKMWLYYAKKKKKILQKSYKMSELEEIFLSDLFTDEETGF